MKGDRMNNPHGLVASPAFLAATKDEIKSKCGG